MLGNFSDMVLECPFYVNDWDQHFINFAVFLSVTDFIGLFVFIFYAGYTICEVDNSVEDVNY